MRKHLCKLFIRSIKLLPVALYLALFFPSPGSTASLHIEQKSFRILGSIEGVPGRGLFLAATDGCQPAATQKKDVIDCTGTISGAVQGKGGNDTITIQSGAIVIAGATNPKPQSTGIDGQAGNDNTVNMGLVAVEVLSTGKDFKNVPAQASTGNKDAKATGIAGADGSDAIQNLGTININALANNLLSDGSEGNDAKTRSSQAVSNSTGIDGGGDKDSIGNSGNVIVTATSLVEKLDLSGDSTTAAQNSASSKDVKAIATSAGVSGGDGADSITNAGNITASASSVMVAVSTGGSNASEGSKPQPKIATAAEATATGIDGGDGNDNITNRQNVSALATALAPSVGVDLESNGKKNVDATLAAKAESTGITGGDGDDNMLSEGIVTSTALSSVFGISGSISKQGNSETPKAGADSSASAESSAVGIDGSKGNNAIKASGAINVIATAESLAASGSLAVEGNSAVKSTSTAKSSAIGIDASGKKDAVTNSGLIDALATSKAAGFGIAVSNKDNDQPAPSENAKAKTFKAAVDTSVTAEATATGIVSDSSKTETTKQNVKSARTLSYGANTQTAGGNDRITNDNAVVAAATAVSTTGSGGLSVEGEASAKSTSTAKSTATGIDAGAGNDTLNNSGLLNATATSLAEGLSVGVSVKSDSTGGAGAQATEGGSTKASVESSVAAETTAAGIIGDSGDASSRSTTTIAIRDNRLTLDRLNTKEAASGDDTITNSGAIAVLANSLSTAGSGALTIEGGASAKSTSEAKSTATGIDAGAGNDKVNNSGVIVAEAGALATGLSVGLGLKSGETGGTTTQAAAETNTESSKSTAETSVTATATATGIIGDSGEQKTRTELNLSLGIRGLEVNYRTTKEAASGDDTISNSGGIGAIANSFSAAGSGALTIEGDASAKSTSTAKSTATGIDAGAGNDKVNNSGVIVAEAGALATGLSVGLGLKSGETGGTTTQAADETTKAAKSTADSSVTATSTAAGIIGDSGEQSTSTEVSVALNLSGLAINHRTIKEAASGDDTITNSANITALANSISAAGSGALTIEGEASAKITSEAKSTATGIDAGAGSDVVTNSGNIIAESGAAAAGLSIGLGLKASQNGGSATTQADATNTASSKSAAEASVTAEATAAGILGDSGEGTSSKQTALGIQVDINNAAGGISLSHSESTAGATGNDTISNTANITVLANSVSAAGSGAVSIEGEASAKSTSTAKSTATGINSGAGNDVVINSGNITAETGAAAAGLSIALGLKAGQSGESGGTTPQAAESSKSASKSTAETSVTAEATAAGIIGDGGEGTSSKQTTLGIQVDVNNVAGGINLSHGENKAGATGNDAITSSANITVLANSVSAAGSGAVSIEGDVSAKATSTAKSTATGIDAGAGNDVVTNSGNIIAAAAAGAAGLSIQVSLESDSSGPSGGGSTGTTQSTITDNQRRRETRGQSIGSDTSTTQSIFDLFSSGPAITAEASVNAEATAAGILGDSGEGTSNKQTVLGIQIDVNNAAGSITFGHSENKTGATGNDTINNTANITVLANSASAAGAGAVTLQGDASAKATSTAKSTATGIDAGAGNDVVTNSGNIIAEAGAGAAGLSVQVSLESDSGDSTGGGSTSATQSIIADNQRSRGTRSQASGSDQSTAQSIRDLFSSDSQAAAEASVTAEATAAGIVGDSGEGTSSKQTSLGIQVDVGNATGGISLSHIESKAAARGNDTITNSANITALANSASAAGAASISLQGDASAKATSTAKSTATGIDAGAGNDIITNSGTIVAEAGALAGGLSIGLGLQSGEGGGSTTTQAADINMESKKSSAETSVTAEATAAGILGDSGEGTSSKQTTLGIQVDVANATGAISFSHSENKAGATGNDTITNSANITVLANAASAAGSGAVSFEGDASAKATSTAKSTATGIDAGAGNDVVTNSGNIIAQAGAVAAGLTVAVGIASSESGSSSDSSGASQVAADAGTDSKKSSAETSVIASATAAGVLGDSGEGTSSRQTTLGIQVDINNLTGGIHLSHSQSNVAASGNDNIVNDGRIDVVAVAASAAGAVAIGIDGEASVKSTSEAKSLATGIGAGAGDDSVTNKGDMTATAVSAAGALSIAITTKGGARAIGGIWDSGSEAEATAVGIAGDSAEKNSSLAFSIDVDFSAPSANFAFQKKEGTVSGADTIRNEGSITTTAVAEAPAVNVAIASSEGMATAISSASAQARSSAIDAGGGKDEIFNSGELTSTAVANANAISVSVAGKGTALAGDAIWSGGAKSTATAKGIDGDGEGSSKTTEITASVGTDGVNAAFRRAEGGAVGNDTITNQGSITATAVAVTPAISVAIGVEGMAAAVSTSEAKSLSTAIDAGDGSDFIQNSAELAANATSVAVAVNVAVSPKSGAVAADAIWDGGTTAEATAKGIDADGGARSSSAETSLAVTGSGVTLDRHTSDSIASGSDTITNESKIGATAVAVAPAVSVAVSAKGAGIALSTATAKAAATSIDAGSGNDTITNTGELTATATGVAAAVNVAVTTGTGLALAGNPVWNGGTTSEAVAKGIDADGTGVSRASDTNLTIVSGKAIFEHQNSETGANGDDTITNLNKVDATATAVSAGLTGGVAVTGVSGAISTSTAKSEATSIDAGAGNDTINSSGDLTATATSVAASVNVAVVTGTGVAIAADALFDGGTTALATAKGIDADGTLANKTTGINITAESGGTSLNFSEALSAARGNDTITNDGKVGAVATAVAPSVSVAVAVSGAAVSASTATAKADATAIDAGGGDDSITNRGELNATATSVAASVNVSVTPGGLAAATDALWSGGTTADAVATGIHADGNKASTQLDATLAFNGGKPNLNFQTSLNPVTGNDTITNEAKIDTNATAVSGSIGVSVAVAGVAAAASTATATADATAINAGGGNDSITNKGELSSTAVAVAAAVVVSVTPAGVALAADAVWDGGTTAQAKATGISADGNAQSARGETTISTHDIRNKTIVESVSGNDTIVNEAKIDAMAVAVSPAVDVAVAVAGVSAAVANSTAKAAATAIDAGGGNDSITNKGELTATSVANADTLNVSVSVTGVGVAGNAVWDGGTTVEATATGIDADGKGGRITTERNINLSSDGITIVKRTTEESGSGNDVIVNEGKIVAQATAVPVSVAVGVAAYAGVGAAVSTSTAKSSASAIDAGGGADTVTNSGELQASATSTAVTVNGSFSLIGAGISADAVWDGGTTAEAKTVGIDADGQGSRLTTERTITTNGSGFNSDTQIDTESLDGNDSITNSGKITAHADANAPSVAVGLGGILGAAIATSTAKSQATAIAAGGGDDTVRNSSELTATAEATAIAVNVSVSVGAALSINDFWDGGNNADAIAKGIDAGDGNDTITNTARIEADATTKSPSVSVALSGIIGAAISSSTSKANATAIGAGVGDDTVDNSGELFAKADSSATTVNVSGSVWGAVSWDGGTTTEAKAKGIDAGDGKDTVANTARIQADATANTNSVNVSIGGFVGAAISTAKATAKATAIDAGEGDDTVINHGPLIADAKADADAVSVAATFGGGLAAAWDGGTTAEAISKGIDFGAGNDILTNDGFINATSTASTTSTGVGVNLLGGVAAAVARSTATARTTGVDGGDGDDDVGNSGILIVQADADAKGTSVSVAMIGAAAADTASNAIAQATGIDGGQGNDSISNNAPMTVIASATAKGTSVEVAVVGAAVPNPFLESGTKADATAIGLTGGAGTDTITNFSALTLSSTAKTDATAVSVGLIDFGGGSANVSAEANAKAIGIKGGADLDILENRGAIIASVTAEAPVRGVDVSLAGVANADFSTGADAAAYGMSGGEGDDEITNTNSGVIGLASTAKAPATGTSVNIFGVTEQSVGATATAISIGAEGGEGNDTITNAGIISANAAAEATVSGTSWTLAGKSTQQGISIGVAQATGISGGAGADIIVNSGGLVVGGTTTLKTEGSSTALFAFGGTTANASVNGSATAVGIDGGDDADEITNAGAIAVTAASNSSANGSSFTLTGSAKGNAGTTAAATGIGIGGGLGDDVIVITDSGVLSVTATTNATAENSAWTLAGASGGDAALQATSKSTGIAGNAGADQIYNDGKMATTATATLNVKGGSETIFGGAGSGSAIKASVNAIGIDGGDGSNWIENTNTITVTGISQMTSSTAAFSFTGSPADDALLTASSRATGISTGNDDDWIHNRAGGDISVLAQSQQTATGGSSSTVAGNAASSAASRGTASAVGIDGGGGNNSILNDGVVRADANPSGNVSNNSNAGFLFGSSGAASAINLTANSRGALSGDGVNSIINNGLIDARARSSGLAKSTANGADIVNGDTVASATATVNATAHGISAGEGNNQITNNKTINALADPAIKADAFSNGNGADGDGNATAKATVTATAVGIQVGGGNNQITNNDSITVSAKPSATADSFADSDAGGTARSTATATASATAIGIRAGKGDNDGDNLIINNGILSVAAEPTGNATAKATVDQISVCIPFTRICAVVQVGNKILNATSPESGTAIGIETGSGNDTIVNSGTITVTKTVEDVTTNGVAIRSGAGNDTVVLGNGSVTTGSIELGDGNDTLHLVGTPTVNGSISSGSGTNSLIFEGAGSFSNSLSGFVNTLKQGAGTFTVPSLPTMTGKLEVKEGTLQVNSNYQMAASSTFQTTVNGDGSHGQLKVGGTAGLDGALVVDKGPGTYVNGTTYDVVSANSVTGGFDSQQLPVPTALVSFSTNQTPTAFQVQANVAALSTVARNGVGASLARHLDQLTPTANSDLARVMGDFQQLSQRDFNRGFSSLSQERYQPFSAATLNTLQRYNGAVHTRMNIARAAFRGMPLAEAIDRTDLAQELALAQFGFTPLTFDLFDRSNSQEVRRRPGFWLSGFGNTMAHNEDGGFSGFNHRTQGIPVGFDFRLSDHFIAGVAATQSHGTLSFQNERGTGRSEGVFTTVYGSYFTDHAELEGMFSYGRDNYTNVREIALGNLNRRASSEHDGDVFSARFEGRYHFNLDNLKIEPFVSMQYSRLSIAGFRESGAGDLGLIVNQRSVDALASQVGLRLAHPLSFGAGLLIPELTAAWQHDFRVGDSSISASFRGASHERFRIAAPDDFGSALKLGGALTFVGNQRVSAAAGVNAVLGKDKPQASGLLQLQFRW